MYLRLIIGRAGAGKTTACLQEIGRELERKPLGTPLILLVPEQASFQIEHALTRVTSVGGFMRAQVLGFNRLAHRLLQEEGGVLRLPLGEMGKRMILRRLLEKKLDELRVFGRAARLPGFVDKLARALRELKAYRLTAEELEHCLTGLEQAGETGQLLDKLRDLQLILTEFTYFLQDRFIDPDDYLTLAAEKIVHSQWLSQANIWVDGFTGFTPQEYTVLEALLRHTTGISLTLCIDPGSAGRVLTETEPFYPVWETYNILVNMAQKVGLPVKLWHIAENENLPRFLSPQLAYLESAFFDYRTMIKPGKEARIACTARQKTALAPAATGAEPVLKTEECSAGAAQGIKVIAAADRRAEVEGMAREIINLCRSRGFRWREIVVLLRDVDLYSELIEAIFNDYGIPFFLDHKRTVLQHPLVELIRAALETVTENWAFDPIFRYLKTDLVPVSREEVDLLENYVLEHGIRGSRWYDNQPWSYHRRLTLEDDDEISAQVIQTLTQINCIRDVAVAALAHFYRVIQAGVTVADYTEALYGLLEQLEVPKQLEHWATQASEEGRLEEARKHEQIWGDLVTLLDEVVEALGEEGLALNQYTVILDAGLAALRLGLIPPGLDQVVVGSLDRSRSPQVRAAFLPGLNDGVLPARLTEEGIFTEIERERLLDSGLPLAPGVRRRVFDEQFIVYQALTRASEQLVLSYPLADGEGRALRPSPVVHRVREIFPDLVEGLWLQEPGAEQVTDLDFVARPGRCLTYLAGRLRDAGAGREINPLWWDVYNWFVRNKKDDPLFARVVGSLFYRNREERLPRALSRQLYGQPFKTGVSGLEKFRSCPFAHFLSNGLRLKDRAVFRLQAPGTGQFFHAALKLFAQRLQAEGLDWGKVEADRCRELAGEVVDTLAPRLQSEILLSSARHFYLTGRLKRIVQRSALVLAEHARRGRFRPVGLELAFGPGGDLPGVIFTLSGGGEMLLTGRIDRLDAAQTEEGNLYLRVIDYKSGATTINLSDIWHGLNLQLLTYLEVALEYSQQLLGSQGLPGAVLYFRIAEPLLQTDGTPLQSDETEQLLLKELKMKGLLLAESDLVRLMDSMAGIAPDILPVSIKKDGSFAARSSVLDREQFAMLRAYLRQQLISAGEDILAGVKEISPYRQGEFRYCRYCSYKPVCQFDLLLPDNSFRIITPEKDALIWLRIQQHLEANGDLVIERRADDND
ncbi:ATP-dependent helicase/deoxyribonuclease subunit B [Sporotomaculum syntrophicum]|uniref:ATP-dependent helicase/deoxyribonuclease subunit B n=1 Tax=Sporotomaculum syntrophicum TaxID=182264 RepID=A0A9D2WNH8_9FIRM|nr:helicase-exonuclease AddAB subunit AddB [Sporotomaculum syntrophicum]KAF1084245.1 ATP-dependent helicase/deoxyribonuclease subunit B [Sporotomaculum syntrophicum]